MDGMKQTTQTVGHRIKALRGKRRLTLRGLATASGVDASTLCRLEAGVREPNWDHLSRIAAALRTSPRNLIPPRAA